jgi:hypothetical protein
MQTICMRAGPAVVQQPGTPSGDIAGEPLVQTIESGVDVVAQAPKMQSDTPGEPIVTECVQPPARVSLPGTVNQSSSSAPARIPPKESEWTHS